eukprot:scaffold1242_cov139-Skeletonema_marinoi.AAC.1
MMKGVLLLLIAILAVASSSSSCHALATAHSSSSISGNRFLHTNYDENKQYRLLTSVRGGDVLTVPRTAPASTSASSKSSTAAGSGGLTTTALQATATAAETAPINTRQRYWRIARELGNHVWPKVPPKAQKKQSSDMAADQVNGDSSATHANHISAAENKKDRRQALSIRYRVVASILLMLAGKGVTIATPFLFKMLVDIVPSYAEGVATSTVKSLPILLLLAYGTCRSLSSLFREMTNAIFAHVAQSAIRRCTRKSFGARLTQYIICTKCISVQHHSNTVGSFNCNGDNVSQIWGLGGGYSGNDYGSRNHIIWFGHLLCCNQ